MSLLQAKLSVACIAVKPNLDVSKKICLSGCCCNWYIYTTIFTYQRSIISD